MYDPAQLHELTRQTASIRERLDAMIPLTIDSQSIAALHRRPEPDRTCHQSLALAFFHITRASHAMTEATLAADRGVERDGVAI